jgi:cytoplasmic iron level regulating protein YaaA (DUF328/UPF0246 family)
MLIVISPAKTLDFETPARSDIHTQADFLDRSEHLIDQLTSYSPHDLQGLMKLSEKLAELNVARYHDWQRPFTARNAKQAIFAFQGDVYTGLQADELNNDQLQYAQSHLRILSGLYGVLRPLDLIQPYRLEMGIKLNNDRGRNLYDFWGSEITNNINNHMQEIESKYLINLASNEYFKSIKRKELNAEVLTPTFKDWKNGQYKIISFFAKKARGTMSAWIIKNKVKTRAKLEEFNLDGYHYSQTDSTPATPVFLRKQ